TDLPSLMSVYKRVRRQAGVIGQSSAIDQAVEINGPAIVAPQDIAPGQFGGLLGREYDPMFIGNANTDALAVPGLMPLSELPPVRIRQRENLRAAIDRYVRSDEAGSKFLDLQGQYHKAFSLLHDPQTRLAFDLS